MLQSAYRKIKIWRVKCANISQKWNFFELNSDVLRDELGISDLETRVRILSEFFKLQGILHSDKVVGLAQSGERLVSFSADKSVRLWKLKDGILISDTCCRNFEVWESVQFTMWRVCCMILTQSALESAGPADNSNSFVRRFGADLKRPSCHAIHNRREQLQSVGRTSLVHRWRRQVW